MPTTTVTQMLEDRYNEIIKAAEQAFQNKITTLINYLNNKQNWEFDAGSATFTCTITDVQFGFRDTEPIYNVVSDLGLRIRSEKRDGDGDHTFEIIYAVKSKQDKA